MNLPFRLIDFIVILLIAAALLATTFAARHQAQEADSIARCAQNLQRISAAILQYQESAGGEFPRTLYEPDAPLVAYTGVNAANPFASDGPAANDVTAAAFLLAREMKLPPAVFTCPAALRNGLAEVDVFSPSTVRDRSNFSARVNYNYSLVNMYPGRSAAVAGYSLDRYSIRLPPSFVIAGDTNPGGDGARSATTQMSRIQLRLANSPNHQRNGQNFLFVDGRVEYLPTAFTPVTSDNAYASRAQFPQPADVNDAVLMPVWSEGPDVTPAALVLRRWVLVGAAVATFGLLGFIVLRSRHKTASN